jgi:hypothetical protein
MFPRLFLMLIFSSSLPAIAQEKTPLAANDQAHLPQMSGTVVDASGAVIAGATLQLRSVNGDAQKTAWADRNGSFIISGLSAGSYRLVVSHPGFETKDIPINIGSTEWPTALRISLSVGPVNTTINVQSREDSLIVLCLRQKWRFPVSS